MSPEFLVTTLIIVASPGIGATYTIASGLNRGAKASLWAAFACTLGIVPHLIAAMTGLAALLQVISRPRSADLLLRCRLPGRKLSALSGLDLRRAL